MQVFSSAQKTASAFEFDQRHFQSGTVLSEVFLVGDCLMRTILSAHLRLGTVWLIFSPVNSGLRCTTCVLGSTCHPSYCVSRFIATWSVVLFWNTHAVSILQQLLPEQLGAHKGRVYFFLLLYISANCQKPHHLIAWWRWQNRGTIQKSRKIMSNRLKMRHLLQIKHTNFTIIIKSVVITLKTNCELKQFTFHTTIYIFSKLYYHL